MTPAMPTYGSFYNPYAGRVGPLCLCQIWSGQLYTFKSCEGSQIFEIGSRDRGHAHLGVDLWPGRSRGPSFVCGKFEADISIRSKVIRGSQNFEIRSRDPGHAHFPIDLRRRPYNTLALPCECVIRIIVTTRVGELQLVNYN